MWVVCILGRPVCPPSMENERWNSFYHSGWVLSKPMAALFVMSLYWARRWVDWKPRADKNSGTLSHFWSLPSWNDYFIHAHSWSKPCAWLFAIPWTVAHQAPLSVGFSRQEHWSGLPFPPPGDLPNPGMEPRSLSSPALADGFFITTWEALCLKLDFNCFL